MPVTSAASVSPSATSRDREGRRRRFPSSRSTASRPPRATPPRGDLGRFASWQFRLLEKRRHRGPEGDDAARDAAHPLGGARLRGRRGGSGSIVWRSDSRSSRPRRELPRVTARALLRSRGDKIAHRFLGERVRGRARQVGAADLRHRRAPPCAARDQRAASKAKTQAGIPDLRPRSRLCRDVTTPPWAGDRDPSLGRRAGDARGCRR